LNFCKNYQIFRLDRILRSHGGVMFLIHKSINARKKFGYCFEGYIELLCLKLSINQSNFEIVLIYRSPLSTKTADANLLNVFYNWKSSWDNLVVGDFNLPNFSSATKTTSEELYEKLFTELGLIQKVNMPTRFDKILDLVFVSNENLITNLQVQEPFSTSDHNKIIFNLNISKINNKFSPRIFCNFRCANYDLITDYISTYDWENLFTPFDDVHIMWETFKNVIEYVIDILVPKKQFKCRSKFRWSFSTKNIYKKKLKLWHKYKNVRSKENYKEYLKVAKEAKKFSYDDIKNREIQILKNANINAFYSYVNSKLISKNAIPPLYKDGRKYESPETKANLFQSHFSSVFTTDDGILPYMQNFTNSILENVEISEEIVLMSLKKLPSKSSSGPDHIPSIFLKNTAQAIDKPLTVIFNKSFQTGIVPSDWLDAKVVPIFKKGEISDVKNYRPISLTSVASKVFERIIKDQMLKFLLENKKQHGFISKRSTLTKVINSLSKWFNAINENQSVHCILIDFAKAFDTVSHSKLLLKLPKNGISGKLLIWLEAFLTKRKQYVIMDEFKSPSFPVKSGVPQGTVLGPLLFKIYVNDLETVVINSEIALFADDAKIFKVISNDEIYSQELQEDIYMAYS
ncbi:MAG: hypothetical protein MJA29_08390, partial [Candidatus Omnitrophica bacterium]|nr:hypothetical protein [Candidatus Omnitrophota bacterium]